MRLAISSYEAVPALADTSDVLTLAWTLDERDVLDVDLRAILSAALEAEIASGLESVHRYAVDDPYGERRLGPAVAAFFGLNGWSPCLTCAAGVGSSLHSLALLARGRRVYVAGDAYPDFPFWATASGALGVVGSAATTVEEHARASHAAGASLVFLERPALVGDAFARPDDLRALCEAVAETIVVVDESNANYRPPAFSAAPMVELVPNLVVVRGFTKAYGLGGLRLAYCVASRALTGAIRSAVPPLLAASLSLTLGRRVLELGDITRTLRERIHANKDVMQRLLHEADIAPILLGGRDLPYIFLDKPRGYVHDFVETRGIVGKWHVVWSATAHDTVTLYRMSVPLLAGRLLHLRERLTAPLPGADPITRP